MNNTKTFKKLCLNDVVFEITESKGMFSILEHIIKMICEDCYPKLILKTSLGKSIIITKEHWEGCEYGHYFMVKADAQKRLKELCLERIAELAKLIADNK